jgi:hypothetical protein
MIRRDQAGDRGGSLGVTIVPANMPETGRIGVGVLDVPFTLPAASANTSAGVSTLHVLYLRPSWP